jgi:hypothetical protein
MALSLSSPRVDMCTSPESEVLDCRAFTSLFYELKGSSDDLPVLSIQGGNGGNKSWCIFSANANWEVKFTYGEGGDKSFWVLRPV